jgi:CRP-like cAMP-binding protein
MKRFEELKPKLKPCRIYSEGRKLMLEDESTRHHLVLPTEARPILDLLDGEHTIKAIISELYRRKGTVRFKSLFTTVRQLEASRFLESGHGVQADESQDLDPSERESSLVERFTLRWTLAKRVVAPARSRLLFFGLSGFVILAATSFLASGDFSEVDNGFARVGGSYLNGLAAFLVATSVLVSFKHLVSSALLALATGKIYNPSLVLSVFGLSYRVNDSSIYLVSGKAIPLLHHLAASCCYLLGAGAAGRLLGDSEAVSTVRTIAVFLTLIDLNPYVRSELTKVFALFYREKLFTHLVPYLKNRSILAFMSRGERIPGENELVSYSIVAIAWSVGFLLFCATVVEASFPNLVVAMIDGSPIERVAAAAVLGSLGLVAVYFLLDLLSTLIRNLVFPMTNTLLRAFQRLASRTERLRDPARVRAVMRKNPLFQDMADEMLDHLIRKGAAKRFKRGSPLIIQGTRNRHLFVLIDGRVSVRKREPTGSVRLVTYLEAGAVFGEVSVIEDKLATADVLAEEGMLALLIDREALKGLPSFQGGEGQLESMTNKIRLGHYIASSELFRGLPKEVISLFVSHGRTRTVPQGEMITRQGSVDKTFYLLVRGKVDVLVNGRKVSEIAQGGFFGEIALIADVPRTASVIATEECMLLTIDSDNFWNILSENINLSMFIEAVAEHRARETDLMRAS